MRVSAEAKASALRRIESALVTRIERSGEAQESVIDGVLRSTLHNRNHCGPAVWTNGDERPATAVHEIARGLNDIKTRW